MKKIKYLLVLMVGIFLTTNVYANDHDKITMDIYVDNNGTAHVKQEWSGNFYEKTENYHQYFNIEGASITNYKVSMAGKDFTTISSWDIDGSFDDKAYKAGINYTSEGLELCYGISKYGQNTYTMRYDINGFVATTNDADIVYWTLLPGGIDLNNYYIKIYSDFKYEDTLDVWGYGNYGGYAYVYDGYIELSDESGLDSSEYITVLVKYPKGTFNTENYLNENFDYYHDMAEEGSKSYDGASWSGSFSLEDTLPAIVIFIFTILFPIGIIFTIFKNVNFNAYGTKKLVFEKGMKKLGKDIPYFRDIPCDKDIYKAYWIAGNFNLMKQKNDFLGALLLKWLKEDRIQNIKVTSKWLKKETTALKFLKDDNLSGSELSMYKMMFEASADGVLESNEFKKYCEKHYTKVLAWFDEAFDDSTDKYVNEQKINVSQTKKWYGNKSEYIVNPSIREEAIRMKGLKLFLKEFSNIKDRESIEVKLWEYYLMYAQIFGIAKKVAEEFKNLYPDVITDDYYNNMIFIHTFSHTGVNAASTAKSRAESYSSGGGGFSSGGGGGGSFGGGGSMGSR